ncbi:MAG: MBL fold metallo-hydrolase [Thermomicrobiales bacterium]
MELTFLGTAASEGYPDAFCGCPNCETARVLGGKSLRKRSAALIDREVLLDLGPDVMAASLQHGVPLTDVRACLLTHEHDDHLDASHLHSRSPHCGVIDAPCLEFYATQGAIDRAAGRFGRWLPPNGLAHSETSARLNLRVCPIEPGQSFAVGPYRVLSVPATHGTDLLPLLFAIERDGRALFYATDTGPLSDMAWRSLRGWHHPFNVVALDHTMGMSERSTGHLNAEQFIEQLDRLRAENLLAGDCRVFAHHLGHHSNPDHETLTAFAAARGYRVAFDGLTVSV